MAKEYQTIKAVSLKMVRDYTVKYISESGTVSNKRHIVDLIKPILMNSAIEKVVCIGLDTQNKPTVLHINNGSSDRSNVFPQTLMKILLLANCTSFILVHNHPSGSMIPSDNDWMITDKLKECGKLLDIKMIDHVIVNADCEQTVSMRDLSRW